MAENQFEKFRNEYDPVAKQVGLQIGVDPNILLSQWGHETGWGKSIIPGTNNLGNIKDISGRGVQATDNKTKSKDKYVKFEDAEIFGMYYADMIKRQYPNVINTGTDVDAFTRGLASGRRGSYFEDDPQKYSAALAKNYAMFPEAGDIKPAPKEATVDEETQKEQDARIQSDIDAQETRQAQIVGGVAGAGVSALGAAKSGIGSAAESLAQRVGTGYRAGTQGGLPGNVGASSTPPPGGLTGTQSQIARIQAGTTGDLGTTGQARMTGFNAETAQKAAAEKAQAGVIQSLKSSGIVPQTASQVFANAPGMTSTPAGVLTPKSELPTYTGSRGPQGQIGMNTRTVPDPKFVTKIASGLDAVNNTFRSLMDSPALKAIGAVGKYAMPPLALADAAGQGTQLLQESRKPIAEQDITKMALHGVHGLGALASAFPVTAPFGIPISLAAEAAQQARDPNSFLGKRIADMQNSNLPYSNPMGD